MPPRRRPPWWPENEQWPPTDWQSDAYTWSGRRRRRGGPLHWGFFPFGCLIALFVLFVVGTVTIAIWAASALVGLVTAPPIVVVGGLFALLLVAIVAANIGRTVGRTVGPIDDLAQAAARIERGDYSVRVRERGTRPVRSLARAFNGMSARLEDLDQRRRTFLADVAHELRTPLSVIAGQLEGIEDGLYPADAEHIAPIQAQLKALDKLIDDLRTVALAEAGSLPLDRKPTDLGALIDETVGAFNSQPTASSAQIKADVAAGLPICLCRCRPNSPGPVELAEQCLETCAAARRSREGRQRVARRTQWWSRSSTTAAAFRPTSCPRSSSASPRTPRRPAAVWAWPSPTTSSRRTAARSRRSVRPARARRFDSRCRLIPKTATGRAAPAVRAVRLPSRLKPCGRSPGSGRERRWRECADVDARRARALRRSRTAA